MTTRAAICLKNVSKVFKRYNHPADRLKDVFLPGNTKADQFYALQDISFEIKKGETVGIIGRNGAGKSTLLQIIAGTLKQTTGTVEINGRVSALLELGSGFNPDFTGRQNIYFNGRIIGISQSEIESHFENIVKFADIGDFIDQPVKTYSSGMFVRLAFSVAIHVTPDILIVDEALSVGDAFFRAKCFSKIAELQQIGTCVLFVSHDMSAVQRLCQRGILLKKGKLISDDASSSISSEYFKEVRIESENIESEGVSGELLEPSSEDSIKSHISKNKINEINEDDHLWKSIQISKVNRITNGIVEIIGAEVTKEVDIEDNKTIHISTGEVLCISFKTLFYKDEQNVVAGFGIRDVYGKLIGGKHSWYDGPGAIPFVVAGTTIKFTFKVHLDLSPDQYLALLGVASQRTSDEYDSLDVLQDAFAININQGKKYVWGQTHFSGTINYKVM